MSITRVLVDASAGGIARRAAEILADRAGERRGAPVAVDDSAAGRRTNAVLLGTPSSSGHVGEAMTAAGITLPDNLGTEGYCIHSDGTTAVVAARDEHGLIYGVGRLLRESTFTGREWTIPEVSLASAPARAIRPIYFATHFGNWYCQASLEDLRRYLEDMALWGYNQLVTWFDFHHYEDFEDGAAVWERLTQLDALAHELGLSAGRIGIANESFAGQAPEYLRASGRVPGTGYDTDLCPSKPEARQLILSNRRAFMERVKATTSLEWLCLWPYDQGGCNCDLCTPWSTTYMNLCRELAELGSEVIPDTEIMLGAWWIGRHRDGEDEAFFAALGKGENWFRAIVAGAEDMRRWAADGRQVPAQYPVLLFPEISMFDAIPWGSRGANPAPLKFAQEMLDLGPHIGGVVPYSEGRYEDINKVIWAALQWEPSTPITEILEAYCGYYFGRPTAVEGAQLILQIEAGLWDLPTAGARQELADRLQTLMDPWARNDWRWQNVWSHTAIDHLRARLDAPDRDAEQRVQDREALRAVSDALQRDVNLHNAVDSVHYWMYLSFDTWMSQPFPALYAPTAELLA